MNERIKELIEQSGFEEKDGHISIQGVYMFNTTRMEKFAELIVRECCDWIDGSPATDAGQLLLTKSFITANLKGHFGVEE